MGHVRKCPKMHECDHRFGHRRKLCFGHPIPEHLGMRQIRQPVREPYQPHATNKSGKVDHSETMVKNRQSQSWSVSQNGGGGPIIKHLQQPDNVFQLKRITGKSGETSCWRYLIVGDVQWKQQEPLTKASNRLHEDVV